MGKEEENTVVRGFKGFSKDFKCRDKQYGTDETFEEEGNIELCKHGMHFCEYPLDVFGYYEPGLGSRYCEVSTDCASPKAQGSDSKRVTSRLSVGVEISIPGIVQAAVKYVLERITSEKTESNTGDQSAATNTGDYSAATNTGNRSAATNTGNRSVATNTGDYSAATNTGDYSAATNTGDYSAATNTGDYSAATNTGNRSVATNTGYYSAATNTVNRSAAPNTGDYSAATNTGDYSAATNTGYRSAATNTGNRSAATNTGDQSAATNTGYRSAATNTGYRSAASVEGEQSVAISTGENGRVKGALGCGICCVERDEDDGHIVAIKAAIVDGEIVKADTWYSVKNEEFVEVE